MVAPAADRIWRNAISLWITGDVNSESFACHLDSLALTAVACRQPLPGASFLIGGLSNVAYECRCLECRIRAAIRGDGATDLPGTDVFAVDTARVVNALTSVLGEVLALRSPSDTEAVIERICHWREYWSQRDHIHAQQPPAGRA